MPSAPVVLSDSQIAAAAYSAGFRGESLKLAVAIALAESSGRPDVVNFLGCVGLWQIYQSVHVRNNPTWTTAWLKVPANNAAAAFKLSNGGRNWIPWEAYTKGMHKQFMARATKAAQSHSDGPTSDAGTPPLVGTPPPSSSSPVDTSVENTKFAPLFDRETWIRILLILLGIILVLNALVRLSGTPGVVKDIAKVGLDIVPVGKLTKIAKVAKVATK